VLVSISSSGLDGVLAESMVALFVTAWRFNVDPVPMLAYSSTISLHSMLFLSCPEWCSSLRW